MQNTIMAIRCPQCGAADKMTIKENHYSCNHCGAEYVVKNNDISIRHYHYYDSNAQQKNILSKRKKFFIFLASLFATVLVIGLYYFISQSSSAKIKNNNVMPDTSHSKAAAANSSEKKQEHWKVKKIMGTTDDKGLAMVSVLSADWNQQGQNFNSSHNFLDPKTGKSMQTYVWEGVKVSQIEAKAFSNGDIYFVLNKKLLHRANRNSLQIEQINLDAPALKSGIAVLEPLAEFGDDGFKIITNEGITLFFYPSTEYLLTSKQRNWFFVKENLAGLPLEEKKVGVIFVGGAVLSRYLEFL